MQNTIIFIDNFDSFSYNLVDACKRLNYQVMVFRNDIDLKYLDTVITNVASNNKVTLMLSPGPSAPQDAGNLLKIIDNYFGKIPMIGICLGHQALGLKLGGQIKQCSEFYHGKASLITHNGENCFANLPNPLQVARYHSLYVDNLKEQYISASINKMCMALEDKEHHIIGLQFHVESILTPYGMQILKQSLETLNKRWRKRLCKKHDGEA